MGEIHACQFDDALITNIVPPLKFEKFAVRVQQYGQLLVVTLPPLCHHNQDVLPRLQHLLKHHVLLAAVTTSDPPVTTIVLPLQKQTPDPEILSDAGLVVKTVLLLTHFDPHPRLFENCECPHGNGVVGRDLKILHLGFLPWMGFDGLRRVDRACYN